MILLTQQAPRALSWTTQQAAFYERTRSTSDSIVLESCAGSGKTTTLTKGIKLLRGSVLAIAFNRSTKEEWEEKLAMAGAIADCSTINALGHRALLAFFQRGIKIESGKVRSITRALIKEAIAKGESKKLWTEFGPIMSLVSKAKHHGLVPEGTPGKVVGLLPDTDASWLDLSERYDIDLGELTTFLARTVLRTSNTMAWARVCDFDDQIYISTLWGAKFRQYDNVVVDEAQDLSAIQHEMIAKSLAPAGRLIAAGDPNQAIYGFRAAMTDSMAQLTSRFDLAQLALTTSFRCSKAVVREAQKVVPDIFPTEDAPEGTVEILKFYNAADLAAEAAILCRTNAPLITTAYRIIGRGVGVSMLGRNIGVGLKALVNKLANGDDDLRELLEKLAAWKAREIKAARAKEQWKKAESVSDKAASLQIIINSVRQAAGLTSIQGRLAAGVKVLTGSTDELLAEIDRLFSKQTNKITLSTIHGAKGLEWPTVFFLEEEKIPTFWTLAAVKRDPEKCAWMLQEEQNLRYVAVTRAQRELRYIDLEGWKA